VRRSFPFFNREVLELALECHPVELVGPGTKKPLRAALGGDVPARNLERPDKGGWGSYLHKVKLPWGVPLAIELHTVVRGDWCKVAPVAGDAWDVHGLSQLANFVQNCRARRNAPSRTREQSPIMQGGIV